MEFFRATPRAEFLALSRIAPRESPAERQRILRRLEAVGLVDSRRAHEKLVRVASKAFPVALHAMLQAKPHVAPLLADARLPLLGVLATQTDPITLADAARHANVHPNTAYRALADFKRRALVAKQGTSYRMADHVVDLRQLARDYVTHVLQQHLEQYPIVRPLLQVDTRLIVESKDPVKGLPPTAHYRFQLEGADVLAPRHQYAITLNGGPISLADALKDATALGTPPRTMKAIQEFLKRRRPRAR